jgi:hypothetical protein
VLNLLGAVLLLIAASQRAATLVFVTLLLYMLCYMPTWGLTSAIAMANSPAEKFPQIRVFGSIGWFASGAFGLVALKVFGTKIDGTVIPLYCGAATSLVAAAVALTIPNTPPPAKGQKASIIDALGLRAMSLMKDLNFALFMVLTLLVMIPFTIYWSYFSIFLENKDFQLITMTMNWGQFVEMFVMLLVPIFLLRVGIKWTMSVGLVALVFRYLFFLFGSTQDQTWMIYGGILVHIIFVLFFVMIFVPIASSRGLGNKVTMPIGCLVLMALVWRYLFSPLGSTQDHTWMIYGGILVHGVIFSFFFVGGQIYVDKKANPQIRAQAQGLLFLLSFGLGLFIGNFFNGRLIAHYTTETVIAGAVTKVYDWNSIWMITTVISAALLVAFCLFFRDEFAKADAATAQTEGASIDQ